jgi:hypothetical protein
VISQYLSTWRGELLDCQQYRVWWWELFVQQEPTPMLGGRPRDELMAEYLADHQNPINKRMHFVGIPALFIAVVLWLVAPYFSGVWIWATVLTLIGLALQLGGHRFEGKPPSSGSDWRFVIIGLLWWVERVRGKD